MHGECACERGYSRASFVVVAGGLPSQEPNPAVVTSRGEYWLSLRAPCRQMMAPRRGQVPLKDAFPPSLSLGVRKPRCLASSVITDPCHGAGVNVGPHSVNTSSTCLPKLGPGANPSSWSLFPLSYLHPGQHLHQPSSPSPHRVVSNKTGVLSPTDPAHRNLNTG